MAWGDCRESGVAVWSRAAFETPRRIVRQNRGGQALGVYSVCSAHRPLVGIASLSTYSYLSASAGAMRVALRAG